MITGFLPLLSKESLILGIAGVFLGFLSGWIIRDSQETAVVRRQEAAATAPASASASQTPRPLDQSRVASLKAAADRDASDAASRVQLGDLYFDAERYDEAIQWYEAALTLAPRNVDASTDLGVAYYYTNQIDRALAQFDRSLEIDAKHSKTLLNIGIVRAFGKEDLEGAASAWQRVVALAPDSPEGRAAKQALDGLRAAHPDVGKVPVARPPGPSD